MAVADVIGVRQFALAFMLQAAIIAIVGLRVAGVLAFPLLFLLFAVPAGEFLVPTMIDRTADFTVAALRASGVPVYREVNHFVIPSGAWSVVEACSGLRYLIASVMIGVVYAAVSYRSVARRAAFIAASVLVAAGRQLASRVHDRDDRSSVEQHARRRRRPHHLRLGLLRRGDGAAVLGGFVLVGRRGARPGRSRGACRALGGCTSGSLLRGGRGGHRGGRSVARRSTPLIERVPGTAPVTLVPIAPAGNWTPAATMPAEWVPSYAGFTDKLRQGFSSSEGAAGVHIAYYRDQRKEHELVTSTNQLVLAHEVRWKPVERGDALVAIDGGKQEVHRAVLAGERERLVVYRLYWVDGKLTASDYGAKAQLAWSRLTGGSGDAALVVVFAPEREGRDLARDALEALLPSIVRTLAVAREAR